MHKEMTPNVSWKDITPGGNIYTPGNAENFKTGDWRSRRPVYMPENCKQCLLCFPICPDDAIPINEQGLREDFDYSKCKGCGACAKVCPFGAIRMEEEGGIVCQQKKD